MLVAIACFPLVHNRAVRLTKRRIEAATPTLVRDIHADKDRLRADFAMSTQRLETSVEDLKSRTFAQKAAWNACSFLILPPNAPPTNGVITLTLSSGRLSLRAMYFWATKGVCVDTQTVAAPLSIFAMAACVSIGACAT